MAERPRKNAEDGDMAGRLRDLEDQLARKMPKPEVDRPMASHDQAHIAWRMVIEIVAGIGLGFGIGFGLDYLFGTKPFLMILFIFLGFAAGVKTMMRSAAELNRKSGPVPEQVKRD